MPGKQTQSTAERTPVLLLLQSLRPGQVEVQGELQLAAELAVQAVARQVGLPGLNISTNSGERLVRGLSLLQWRTCVMAMHMQRVVHVGWKPVIHHASLAGHNSHQPAAQL
jgi:hypothetical protein